jgi:hypothetical protein
MCDVTSRSAISPSLARALSLSLSLSPHPSPQGKSGNRLRRSELSGSGLESGSGSAEQTPEEVTRRVAIKVQGQSGKFSMYVPLFTSPTHTFDIPHHAILTPPVVFAIVLLLQLRCRCGWTSLRSKHHHDHYGRIVRS